MAARFQFEHSLDFAPEHATETLRSIPALPGVFALFGADKSAQPYLTRAADLRRRITRILAPPQIQADAAGPNPPSKRLNLGSRVARIDYTVTGSDFESTLALYHLSAQIFGLDEARRRLKLRTPFFLRFAAENNYPRLYTTNRLSRRAVANTYGPFPSRAAADRYCEAVLDLFLLRRCHEELHPTPDHPGCIYGEMGKCLAPCNQAQIPAKAAAYAAEAAAVEAFLDTRGESLLAPLIAQREQASASLDFERAAELHTQVQKVKAAIALADELVQPIPKLRAVIVQKAAKAVRTEADSSASLRNDNGVGSEILIELDEPTAAIFLLDGGCLIGSARLSTLGVRAAREQTAVGSSLFAQPLMLSAVPLDEPSPDPVILSEAHGAESKDPDDTNTTSTSRTILSIPSAALNPEARAAAAIATLEAQTSAPTDLGTLSDHLSLVRRWYYRPEKQRVGEVFFTRDDSSWPLRRILRGAARMALGEPTPLPEVRRDLAQRNSADTLPSDSAPPSST